MKLRLLSLGCIIVAHSSVNSMHVLARSVRLSSMRAVRSSGPKRCESNIMSSWGGKPVYIYDFEKCCGTTLEKCPLKSMQQRLIAEQKAFDTLNEMMKSNHWKNAEHDLQRQMDFLDKKIAKSKNHVAVLSAACVCSKENQDSAIHSSNC